MESVSTSSARTVATGYSAAQAQPSSAMVLALPGDAPAMGSDETVPGREACPVFEQQPAREWRGHERVSLVQHRSHALHGTVPLAPASERHGHNL